MPGSRHVDVVVVGAGIAGLSAARRLLAADLTVAVHEARGRVGGRLLSVSGQNGVVDLGATWFWPNEPYVQALAEQLRVGTFEQSLTGDAMFESEGRAPQRISGNPIDVRSGRFTQSAQVLAERAAEELPGGTLRLADPVTAVHVQEDRVLVQAVSGPVSASHVVLAVPPALAVESIDFAPELPEPVRSLAANTSVWMGAITKAVAVYDSAFWREDGLAGAAVSHHGPFRELHDHSGPDASPAAIFGFAGSDQFTGTPITELAAAFVAQLTRIFGHRAASPRQVHVVDWSRERWTSPTTPSPRASTATYSHPQLQEPLLGRLHWASTETAPAYAGHIEGALRAGTVAADTVVRLLDAAPGSAPDAADP